MQSSEAIACLESEKLSTGLNAFVCTFHFMTCIEDNGDLLCSGRLCGFDDGWGGEVNLY